VPEPTTSGGTGGCLCGAVRYVARGPLRGVVNCHCGQCRRYHGHFAAYTAAALADLAITGEGSLRWFQSSPEARRGFCANCGSSLFWQRLGSATISVAAGTLDEPTGLRTIRHIFAADAGDYYRLEDGLETFPGTMERRPPSWPGDGTGDDG
jgi:hypothetical protein